MATYVATSFRSGISASARVPAGRGCGRSASRSRRGRGRHAGARAAHRRSPRIARARIARRLRPAPARSARASRARAAQSSTARAPARCAPRARAARALWQRAAHGPPGAGRDRPDGGPSSSTSRGGARRGGARATLACHEADVRAARSLRPADRRCASRRAALRPAAASPRYASVSAGAQLAPASDDVRWPPLGTAGLTLARRSRRGPSLGARVWWSVHGGAPGPRLGRSHCGESGRVAPCLSAIRVSRGSRLRPS
jgi:hypothetical protein